MYVVIFRSTRTLENQDLYRRWANQLGLAVKKSPGYISHFGFRDQDSGEGVTISYFESEEAIRGWKALAEHLEAQNLGREEFYSEYRVEVAQITRAYGWKKET
jgi:heme-degrading monooxygenase HmoA